MECMPSYVPTYYLVPKWKINSTSYLDLAYAEEYIITKGCFIKMYPEPFTPSSHFFF